MATSVKEKLESFFINLDLSYEEVSDNMWIISDERNGLSSVVVYAEDDLVTLRAKIMEVPAEQREDFFEELLRLNAEMVHGAYAIEEDRLTVLSCPRWIWRSSRRRLTRRGWHLHSIFHGLPSIDHRRKEALRGYL